MAKALKTKALPDGFFEYTTVDGDLVDQIAFRHFGTHDGTTEMLYNDNPKLLDLDMILDAGVTIRLRPKPPEKAAAPQISLFD